MKNRPGAALLIFMLISSLFLLLTVFVSKMVYNTYATVKLLARREQAFWLAEGGAEAAKVKLAGNAGWYTDLNHYPEDDARWLKAGAIGQNEALGEGRYKIVKEKDREQFYSIGLKGGAVVVIKVKFVRFPFKAISWEEI